MKPTRRARAGFLAAIIVVTCFLVAAQVVAAPNPSQRADQPGQAARGPEAQRSALPAPTPLRPAAGEAVIVPTFSWQSVTGAHHYELQVGPQSNPLLVYWHDTTYLLALTPDSSQYFPNEPLCWRVRAYENSTAPGPWSSTANFTKQIPAPALISPAQNATIIEPALRWNPAEGAATYRVDLSADPTFSQVDYPYTT